MTEEAGRAAPLAQKLGIRPGDFVGLLGAPPGENAVRRAGLSIGLVDIKVCAIDSTWSGLFFVRRRS